MKMTHLEDLFTMNISVAKRLFEVAIKIFELETSKFDIEVFCSAPNGFHKFFPIS